MKFSLLILQLCFAVSAVLAASLNAEQVKNIKTQNGIIRLTDKTFSAIVQGPRDYSIAVLLTAEGVQYGCQFCKLVGPQYQTLAHSWREQHPDGNNLFFAVADIADCPGVYKMMSLSHAPSLYVYGPTEGDDTPLIGFDSYTFPQSEDQLEGLLGYFASITGERIRIVEPFRWDRVGLTVTTVAGIVGLIAFAHKPLLAIIRSKQIWVAISMVSIIMFIAGHMFNMIRKTPYIVSDGRGGATYFVGGHSNQIAVETQIIAVTYVVLAFSTISLVTKVPKIKNVQAQTFSATLLSLVILLAYSFLLEKFHIKNGGYPYHLLRIF
jgi:oligosaccharyltransferase complex subunit gamma